MSPVARMARVARNPEPPINAASAAPDFAAFYPGFDFPHARRRHLWETTSFMARNVIYERRVGANAKSRAVFVAVFDVIYGDNVIYGAERHL
jgi:hypothetical protein